ncbi:hypothetical protein GCM10010270_75870 [Streptomyces violaceus]|nr:hypothetical protein GCM10010270_75870 [Streptomyces janthinus]
MRVDRAWTKNPSVQPLGICRNPQVTGAADCWTLGDRAMWVGCPWDTPLATNTGSYCLAQTKAQAKGADAS